LDFFNRFGQRLHRERDLQHFFFGLTVFPTLSPVRPDVH